MSWRKVGLIGMVNGRRELHGSKSGFSVSKKSVIELMNLKVGSRVDQV